MPEQDTPSDISKSRPEWPERDVVAASGWLQIADWLTCHPGLTRRERAFTAQMAHMIEIAKPLSERQLKWLLDLHERESGDEIETVSERGP